MYQIKELAAICIAIVILASCKNKQVAEKNISKGEKPNIIWLMAEDISTDLECYGMPKRQLLHLFIL